MIHLALWILSALFLGLVGLYVLSWLFVGTVALIVWTSYWLQQAGEWLGSALGVTKK